MMRIVTPSSSGIHTCENFSPGIHYRERHRTQSDDGPRLHLATRGQRAGAGPLPSVTDDCLRAASQVRCFARTSRHGLAPCAHEDSRSGRVGWCSTGRESELSGNGRSRSFGWTELDCAALY